MFPSKTISEKVVNLLDLDPIGLFACLVRGLVRGLVRSLVRNALIKTLKKKSAADVSRSITCVLPAILGFRLARGLSGFLLMEVFSLSYSMALLHLMGSGFGNT